MSSTGAVPRGRARRAAWRLAVVAAALAGVAVGSLGPAAPGPAHVDTGRTGEVRTAKARTEASPEVRLPARPARLVASPEPPVATRLPSGRVVPVRAVSTGSSRRLLVPGDIRVAGWWRGSASVGDPFGSTLIAGHVDSATQGLGPYAELLRARPGQLIVVRSAHLRQEFRVRSLRLVPQGSLARETGMFAPTGLRRLTLVTCAPPYERARGGYQRLAVVTAAAVGGPAPRAGS